MLRQLIGMGYSEAVFYRPYKPDDFSALYAIEEVCFQPPLRYTRAYMRRLTQNPESASWIAEEADAMCGFAIVEWSRESQGVVAYVQTIEVLPEFRARGAGRELLRLMDASAVAAAAVLIWLHVDVDNASAIRLYEAHGYIKDGRRENFYELGRAAFIYAKELRS